MTNPEHTVIPTSSLSEKEDVKERGKIGWRQRVARAIGVTAGVAAMGASAYGTVDSASGQYIHYPAATEEFLAAGEEPQHLEAGEADASVRKLRIGTWNMDNRYRPNEIAGLIDDYDLDVLNLQEVRASHAKRYANEFSNLDLIFITADGTPKPPNKWSGLGNLTIMRHEPQDIKAVSLDGSPLPEKVKLLFTGNPEYIQEKRAAVAVTFTIDETEYTIINTHLSHISDSEIHKKQLEEFVGLVRRNTKEDRQTVACADYNNRRGTVLEAFAAATEGEDVKFDAPETGSTLINGPEIDFCVYNEGVLEVKNAEVLKEPVTDHRPVILELGEFEEDKPAATLSNLPEFP